MFNNFELLKIGDPSLKLESKEVELDLLEAGKYDAMIKVIESIAQQNNYFEVSAPQVGIHKRIAAIKIDLMDESIPQSIDDIPVKIMINPKIKFIDGAPYDTYYETCESAPGRVFAKVRWDDIFLEYFTPECIKTQIFVHGHAAHVVQHVLEHLDGKEILELENEEEEVIHHHR